MPGKRTKRKGGEKPVTPVTKEELSFELDSRFAATKKEFRTELDSRFTAFEKRLDEKFEGFARIIKGEFDRVHVRIDSIEIRLDRVEHRLTTLETRMHRLEDRVGGLEDRVGGLEDKVEGMSSFLYRHIELSDTHAVDTHSTLHMHEVWIKKTARKLNIPYPTVSHRR